MKDQSKYDFETKELAPELIQEFNDQIVVYAPKYPDRKRCQAVEIYYNCVGIIRELSPEKMKEAFQQCRAEQSLGKEIPA